MKKVLATLCVLAASALTVMAGDYPDISIAELNKAIAAKTVTVIDVNGSESYKNGHVPSARDSSNRAGPPRTCAPRLAQPGRDTSKQSPPRGRDVADKRWAGIDSRAC